MSEEVIAQIPGTTYQVKFGFEGKYYALFLCRGFHEFKTMKLNILRGSSLNELPEEVENGLRDLLSSEEVYLSPVIIKNVTNNLIEQIPESGQLKTSEMQSKQFVKTETSVSDLISKSEERAGKKSIIEHSLREKPKYDATADSIGRIDLKKPKPLPEQIIKREVKPVEEYKPIKKQIEVAPEIENEDYTKLEAKVSTLSNEIESLHKIIDKSNQDIESLKEDVFTIKQEVKQPQKPITYYEELSESDVEPEIKELKEEQTSSTDEINDTIKSEVEEVIELPTTEEKKDDLETDDSNSENNE